MSQQRVPPQSLQARAVAFDVLRIVAAVLVVIGHFSFASNVVGRTEMRSSLLTPASMYFYVTVDIFFVVSGYFIMMTALGRDWRSFLVARLARLYPPLVACATLTFIGCRILSAYTYRTVGVSDWLGNVTGLILIPFLGQKFKVVDVVYWTIQIEWVFYAIVTIGLAISLVQLRLMAFFIVIGAITQVMWWYVPGFSLVLFATQWLSRFAVGGILFILSREPRSRAAWALFAAAVLLMLVGVRQRAIDRVNLEHTVFNPWISCAIMSVATAILTWFALHPVKTVRPLVEFAGGVTFPLYLIHHELGCAVSRALKFGDSLAAVLGMTAAMVVLASLVHGLAERPLVPRLRRLLTAWFLRRPADGRAGAGATSNPRGS